MLRVGLTLLSGFCFGLVLAQSSPVLPQSQTVLRQSVSKSVIQSGFGKTRATIGDYNKNLWHLAKKSKQLGAELNVTFHPEFGTPRFMSGVMTVPSTAKPEKIALDFVANNRRALGLQDLSGNRAVRVAVNRVSADALGQTHVRMRLYDGEMEIWPSEFTVHLNKQGSVVALNGNYRVPARNFGAPVVSRQAAIDKALAELSPKMPVTTKARLVLYDWHVAEPLPVWYVEVAAKGLEPLREDVFVDAAGGSVINRIDRITHYRDKTNVTVHPYRDQNTTATVEGWTDASGTFLVHTGKSMFPGTLDPQTLAGTIFVLDAGFSNQIQGVGSDPNGDGVFDDNAGVRAGGAVYYWMSQAYDWLLSTFNWTSFDNNGSAMKIVVNYREDPSTGFDNAYWNGRELVFGDGQNLYYNLAYGADAAAHELCHAITENTAQLVYQFQSGALNESFSDVYASLFDDGNWLIGEAIVQPQFGAPALRSMEDPNQGLNPGANGWQPKNMEQFVNLTAQQDNGGVHVNSGIPNYAFYQIATAIGRGDAGQIFHRALSTYLSRNSDFADMRNAAEQSAKDLFGDGSAQHQAVMNAYSAVGIGAKADDPTPSASTVLYYPLAMPFSTYGEDYSVLFYVSNNSDQAVNLTISGFDAAGNSTGSFQSSLLPRTSGVAATEAGDQWLKIEADGPILGAYQHMNADGQSWSLIPATPFINNGMFIPHIATNTQKFWTIAGLANVVDTPASTVYVDNVSDDGLTLDINQLGKATAFDFESVYDQIFGGMPDTSATGGLWGLFLNFDLAKLEVLDFNLTGAEIFGRKDAKQAAGLQLDATAGRSIYFTHVAANAAFWTGYSLVNVSDTALGDIPVRITCFDNAGTQVADNLVTLPPFGKLLRVTGDELVPQGTSWFVASAQREGASLVGMELFGSVDDRQMAGFQALPYTAKKFYFPMVISGSQGRPTAFDGMPECYTGISIINPNAATVNLTVTLYKSDGTGLQANGQLGPNGKLLNLMSDIFGQDYFGYVIVEADRPVAGFSLSGFVNQQEWAANPMVVE